MKFDTLIGWLIILGFVAFFTSAAVFGFDPGKVLMYSLLIPLGLSMLVAALLAVWAVVVRGLGCLFR